MIDWFILLIPLALLPIVLFFAFIGCGDSFVTGSTSSPVLFTYNKQLAVQDNSDPAIYRFLAEITFKNEIIASVERQYFPFTFDEEIPSGVLNNKDGETNLTVASVGLEEQGQMRCTCHIWPQTDGQNEGAQVDPSPFIEKTKKENENPPPFTLQRNPEPSGDPFRVI